MCSYLGAEKVSIDAAKPRRSKPAMLATSVITTAVLALLAGCDVSLDLGSDPKGDKLTGNDTPIVEEITWIDVSAEELIANYEKYVGKEVFVRNTVMVSKSSPYILVGDGAIQVRPDDLSIINYLAITDTVEVRGTVKGLGNDGKVLVEDAHINVWFSCYPREHTGNDDVGNDRPVQSDTNGIPASGWPGT